MPIFLTVAFIILRAVLILKRWIGLSSGGEKYGSPKEAGKSGGLDVEAAGMHEEVQKERKKERNWTLREETALARSKRAHQNWHCFFRQEISSILYYSYNDKAMYIKYNNRGSIIKKRSWDSVIYITGDCHQDFRRFNMESFPEQKEMSKEDYVIICGDFGGVWNRNEESKKEKSLMDWLDSKLFTTLFVDGNHENFDRLYDYPVEEWHGGKVHKIRSSVIHLMRGQIYEIDGKSIFTFGGASSHDIDGGILEPDDPDYKKKKKELDEWWRPYRINHVSWWKQELPSLEEMEEGRRNLALHDNKVDFIVTHCCATSTQILLGGSMYKRDIETDYLEEIRQNISFNKWFFGHYHDNRNVNAEEILIYEQIIRIV